MKIGHCFSWAGKGAGERRCLVPALCGGFTLLSALPVVFGWPPTPSTAFLERPVLQLLGCLFLTAVLGALLGLIVRLDPEAGPWKTARHIGFVLLAALLTDVHFHTVDVFHLPWQWEQYGSILHHNGPPPEQYRFLSEGTLWWMFHCTGNFVFSYLAYRFFFTFLLCQAIYQFARLYLGALPGVIVVLLYVAFYPLSTRYYYGNLCDPTSHTVMLAALIFCQRRDFGAVFWLIALGTCIKETMLVIAPCWLLLGCDTPLRPNHRDLLRVAVLLFAGALVFLACRLPFHFHCDFGSLNSTVGLMVWSNLGFARGRSWSTVPVFQRYLHPVLFLFMWLPLIVWKRALLPPPLFRTALYLAAALGLINLCFGWNYESRNFIPGLILLAVCAVMIATTSVAPSAPPSPAAASSGHPAPSRPSRQP